MRKRCNNPRTHRRFLERLKTVVVPGNCRPIIITDAGFRGPYEAVSALGWDWIGRVRNEVKYRMDDSGSWKYTRSMHYRARGRPAYVGRAWLSHKRPCASPPSGHDHVLQDAVSRERCRAQSTSSVTPVSGRTNPSMVEPKLRSASCWAAARIRYVR